MQASLGDARHSLVRPASLKGAAGKATAPHCRVSRGSVPHCRRGSCALGARAPGGRSREGAARKGAGLRNPAGPRGHPPRCAAAESGAAEMTSSAQGGAATEIQYDLVVHYYRDRADYGGWGLHVWGDTLSPTDWWQPLAPEAGWTDGGAGAGQADEGTAAENRFGAKWVVPCTARFDVGSASWSSTVHVLPHKGEDKDCTWTLQWTPDSGALPEGSEVVEAWLVQGQCSRQFQTRPNLAALPRVEEVRSCDDTSSGEWRSFWWICGANASVCLASAFLSAQGSLDTARAIWVSSDLIAVDWDHLLLPAPQAATAQLHASSSASMRLADTGLEGVESSWSLTLDNAGLPEFVKEKFPHISEFAALRLPRDCPVKQLVKSQLAITCVDSGTGQILDATEVQVTGVLDDCFFFDGPLGVHVLPAPDGADSLGSALVSLWAPTAQSVELLLFSDPQATAPLQRIPMMQGSRGQWTAQGPASAWLGLYYQYQVVVYHPQTRQLERSVATDPYSRGLSTNGEKSLLVDLNSASACSWLESQGQQMKPAQWESLLEQKAPLQSFSDISLYELHIRDFSAADDSVPEPLRGTYLAFAEQDSRGARHLKALSQAGLTHVHLLPSYDFASVDEDRTTWRTIDEEALRQMPPDSEGQQAAVAAIKDHDAFNWGYDPVHWGVPDGSYATRPDGLARTLEFRTMVQALNCMGLRVVLDVVYNHLHASGPHDPKSVLDKVVPGYYLRRATDGRVEGSACCNDTASEHLMVERLIVDDLVAWARLYKVDGFRFDLMGHLMKRTLTKAREALNQLTPENAGVDGRSIYMYGEGWDFGEVQRNARGVNGSQANMAGTSIGSFNDRLRDSALGGSPFGDPLQQGFLTGLFLQPNEWEHLQDQGSADQEGGTDDGSALSGEGPASSEGSERQRRLLAQHCDWIQLAMAGNLKAFSFVSHVTGQTVYGEDVLTLDGTSVAYTTSPCEVINYVSAHDNETLFDVINIKAAKEASGSDRVRVCQLAQSLLALGQGVPFFHAGDEMLRSKSLDRDSYNSGDWFNRLDFSYQSNNWAVGLPIADKNQEKWDMMRPLLRNPDLKPSPTQILSSVAHLQKMLRIRYSSPLFRLRTADDILERVRFLAPSRHPAACVPPGVIVMRICDGSAEDPASALQQLDPLYKSVVILLSARPSSCTISLPEMNGIHLHPHPLEEPLLHSQEAISSGNFEVPARASVVLVEKR